MPDELGHVDWSAGRPGFIDPAEEFRRPGEEWAAFMSTQAPFWETRAPLGDIGRRLQARYLLAAPEMSQATRLSPGAQGGLQPIPVSFREYLRGYQGRQTGLPMSYYAGSPGATGLRERAQQAAEATMMDPGAYMETFTPGTANWNRAAWMTEQFNPMANERAAAQNQLAIANLLALQRPDVGGTGQGAITGQMASAVRNAMARLQQQRLNTGAARGSFLDWYLGQTDPGRVIN